MVLPTFSWFQTETSKPPTQNSIFFWIWFSGFCGKHLNHWCHFDVKPMPLSEWTDVVLDHFSPMSNRCRIDRKFMSKSFPLAFAKLDHAGHWAIAIMLIDGGPKRYETFPAGKRHQNDMEMTWTGHEDERKNWQWDDHDLKTTWKWHGNDMEMAWKWHENTMNMASKWPKIAWRWHDNDMKRTWKWYEDDRKMIGQLLENEMNMTENDIKTDKKRNEKDMKMTWKRHGNDMKMTWRWHENVMNMTWKRNQIDCGRF